MFMLQSRGEGELDILRQQSRSSIGHPKSHLHTYGSAHYTY